MPGWRPWSVTPTVNCAGCNTSCVYRGRIWPVWSKAWWPSTPPACGGSGLRFLTRCRNRNHWLEVYIYLHAIRNARKSGHFLSLVTDQLVEGDKDENIVRRRCSQSQHLHIV